jgi:hypothetical protein
MTIIYTIGTNERFINNFFTIILHCITIILDFYAMTQPLITITKIIILLVFIFIFDIIYLLIIINN